MKQRFRAREGWLFAPFLLIGAAALFYWRWERVTPALERGMHVSDVTIDAAPGRYQKFGLSHRVTVTISHPWPRPKWWGQRSNYSGFVNATGYTRLKSAQRKALASNVLSQGETVTYLEEGKARALEAKFGGNINDFRFDGTDYVSVDYFDLNDVPQSLGALTLHGAYAIAGQPVLAFQREIRKAGEDLTIPLDKDAGVQLVSVDASRFFASASKRLPGKPRPRATCALRFVVRDGAGRSLGGQKASLMVSYIEVQDASGKKFPLSSTAGLEQTWGAKDDAEMQAYQALANSLKSDESQSFTALNFAPSLQFKGRLTLRGEISLNDRWPLPFQITLPPRPNKPAPLSGVPQFTIPLWRDGRPVKP